MWTAILYRGVAAFSRRSCCVELCCWAKVGMLTMRGRVGRELNHVVSCVAQLSMSLTTEV